MELNKRIVTAREKAGLTHLELSSLISVSVQSIRKWESGKARPIPMRLPKIAKALKCSEVWLSVGKGRMTIGSNTYSESVLKHLAAYDSAKSEKKLLIEDILKAPENPRALKFYRAMLDMLNEFN